MDLYGNPNPDTYQNKYSPYIFKCNWYICKKCVGHHNILECNNCDMRYCLLCTEITHGCVSQNFCHDCEYKLL